MLEFDWFAGQRCRVVRTDQNVVGYVLPDRQSIEHYTEDDDLPTLECVIAVPELGSYYGIAPITPEQHTDPDTAIRIYAHQLRVGITHVLLTVPMLVTDEPDKWPGQLCPDWTPVTCIADSAPDVWQGTARMEKARMEQLFTDAGFSVSLDTQVLDGR